LRRQFTISTATTATTNIATTATTASDDQILNLNSGVGVNRPSPKQKSFSH
jgi:hypothetical protein